jgi:hypothetical protein
VARTDSQTETVRSSRLREVRCRLPQQKEVDVARWWMACRWRRGRGEGALVAAGSGGGAVRPCGEVPETA